jgi:hypothetical protein
MKNPTLQLQTRQKALQAAVRDCVHEIFNKSKDETEARVRLAALQKVVATFKKQNLK